jgi:hypothetical protein
MSVLKNVRLNSFPYPHCFTANALPDNEYNSLSSTRPDWKLIAGDKAVLNNVRVDMNAITALNHSDVSWVWKKFIAHHTSRQFYLEWLTKFAPYVRAYYPWLEWALRKPLDQAIIGIRGQSTADLFLDCQISINTPVKEKSSVIGPHLDNPTELYGAMLYMKTDDEGGDLDIYGVGRPIITGKRLVSNGKWWSTVKYQPNTYIGFLNSQYSVHGVSERDITDKPRLMVNMSIELCDDRKKLFNPEVYR